MTSHVESVALGRYVEGPLDEEDASKLVIALYHEGALSTEDADAVCSHIAVCEECDAELSSLEEVTSLLRTTSCPPLGDEFLDRVDGASTTLDVAHLPPIPPATVRAIDERLAAESTAGQATAEDDDKADSEASSAQVLKLTPKTRFSRWTPLLIAAAAVVFVVGGGVAVLNSVFADQSSSGPHVAEPAPPDDPEIAKPYAPHVVESGTSYTADGTDSEVSYLVDVMATRDEDAEDTDGAAPHDGPMRAPAAPENLERCTELAAAEDGDYPLLVDLAQYEGSPAWVLVDGAGLPQHEAEELHYRVVADTCGSADNADLDILDEGTIPAPSQ